MGIASSITEVIYSAFIYTGRWTVPVVSGSPLPPCAYFMFQQISETKFVIFGGMESVNGTANQTNNLYLLSLREPGLVII